MPSTHYETLGVTKDASAADIRKAYRAAALRWHPDKNPDNREEAEQRFVAIAAAHEVLSDEQARAAYDRGGDALVHRSRTGGDPFGGFDFARASQMFHENFGGAVLKTSALLRTVLLPVAGGSRAATCCRSCRSAYPTRTQQRGWRASSSRIGKTRRPTRRRRPPRRRLPR